MRSARSKAGPNPIWLVSLKEADYEADRQEKLWSRREKMASTGQGERPQEKLTWPTPWSWTSSLQKINLSEKINFHYLSGLVCGILLWWLEQTNTVGQGVSGQKEWPEQRPGGGKQYSDTKQLASEEQGLANFFCEGPDSKQFMFFRL